MSDLPSALAPYLPANPILLALRLLQIVIAATSALLVLLLLGRDRQPVDVGHLFQDMERQLSYLDRERRAAHRWPAELRARVHRRLAGAGLARLTSGHLVGASLLCGTLLLIATELLLPAPPFATMAFLVGTALPWLWLGDRARRRRHIVEQQVAEMLSVMVSAAATGATPQQALLEVLAHSVAHPLAGYLRRSTRDLDPVAGLTDRSFLQVIADLDDELASPSFHLAAQAITASTRLGVDLRESLQRSAALARERIAYRAEARADFAYLRAAAALVFTLPLVFTLVLHWLLPGAVEAAYGGPVGWAVAAMLGGWCLLGYRIVTAGERRSVASLDRGGA